MTIQHKNWRALAIFLLACLSSPTAWSAGSPTDGNGGASGEVSAAKDAKPGAEAPWRTAKAPVADKDESHAEDGAQHKEKHGKGHSSRITDEYIPLQIEAVPDRPKPILELGEPFKGTGTLSQGFTLPTGATWQPSLLVFGTARFGLQTNNRSGARITEAASRFDLFANLQLSGTERLVAGFRTLDQDGRFTGYVLDSEDPTIEEGSEEEFNADVGSLFFEGDFGEIFPNLSPRDFRATDIGFAVGRQPLFFQEGILINDVVDGLGVTRNSVLPKSTSNFRATLFWGWDNVTRNAVQDTGRLFGLFTSTDFNTVTMDIDATYVAGRTGYSDMVAVGMSSVRRFGLMNNSLRLLGSFPTESDAPEDTGILVFNEFSWTPTGGHNFVYINSFYAYNEFFPAALGPAVGGPLGRAGIAFAGTGLGRYGAPLNARAVDSVGAAVGYQHFLAHNRQQLVFEAAGRVDTEDDPLGIGDQYAGTVRYQMAIGRRYVLVLDAFASYEDLIDETSGGGRVELQVRF